MLKSLDPTDNNLLFPSSSLKIIRKCDQKVPVFQKFPDPLSTCCTPREVSASEDMVTCCCGGEEPLTGHKGLL